MKEQKVPVIYRDEPWYSRPIPLVFGILILVAVIGAAVFMSARNASQMTSTQPTSAARELEYTLLTISPDGTYLAKGEVWTQGAIRESNIKIYAKDAKVLYLAIPSQYQINQLVISAAGQLAVSDENGQIWVYSLRHTAKDGLTAKLVWSHASGCPKSLRLQWGLETPGLFVTTTSGDSWISGPVTIIQRWNATGKKDWEYRSKPATPEKEREEARREAGAIVPLKNSVLIAGRVSYTYDRPGAAWCQEIDYRTKKATTIWKQTPTEVASNQTPIRPSALTLSADGKTLFVGTDYGAVVILDRAGIKAPQVYQVLVGLPVRYIAASPANDGVAVSPDGNTVVYTNLNGDLGGVPKKREFLAEEKVFGLEFTDNGRTIIAHVHGEPEQFDLP